jgi:hypothetical protein
LLILAEEEGVTQARNQQYGLHRIFCLTAPVLLLLPLTFANNASERGVKKPPCGGSEIRRTKT